MTVNAPPFAPVVRIYPGGDPMDQSTWGAGRDISADVRHPGSDGGAPIVYSAGRPDEAPNADPGTMTLTLDNRAGHYSTRNPNGRDFGRLTRGTPIELGTPCGADDFGRTVSGGLGTSSGGGLWTSTSTWGADGSSGTAPFATANLTGAAILAGTETNNFDARVTVWPTVQATGAALVYGITGRLTDVSNHLYFSVEFGTAGAVVVKIWSVVAGVFTSLASTTLAGTYSANDKYRLRARAVGEQLFVKAWKPAAPSTPDDDEPDDWDATATNSTAAGKKIGLYFWRVSGNTNAGSVTFRMDDFTAVALEWSGRLVSLPSRWDKSGNNCWAPITAAGVLRGLSRPSQGLKSPLTRQLSTYSHTGYWPLEDASGATSFGSLTTGVRGALYSEGISLAADSTLPGASVSPTFSGAGAFIRAYTPRRQTGTGFSAMFLLKLASLPSTETRIASFTGSGRVVNWNIYIDNSPGITVEGIESDGTLTVNTSNLMGIDPTEWTAYQLEIETAGGTASWAHTYHPVGSTTYLSQSGSFSSSANHRVWAAQLGSYDVTSTVLDGAAFAHLWIGENTLPFVADSFSMVSNGWIGEAASDRIARLCEEEGIPCSVEAGDSELLGVQRVGTLLTALQSAADADYGILYETLAGIGYRPRAARYGQATTFALSVAAGEIDDPPAPDDDDQRAFNDWTVERDDGSFAQAIDSTSIAREGRLPQSARINVETDDVLVDHAGWRLYLGTRPELRWPGLTLDFARNPDLLTTWRTRPAAFRIAVTTALSQVGDEPDVIAEGYQVQLWPSGWKVSLDCSSALPWDVIALDGGLRLDSASSTLAAGIDDNDTSLSVATTSEDRIWVTTALHPAEFPFDVIVGGEVMTVTAITGTSSPQTFTVTRATAGADAKAHDAGSAFSLAIPTYLAL